MRIGIFGGTFDPIHIGHLVVAEQCREQAKLDQVWFIPTAQPPHKPNSLVTSFDRRADMVRLAIAGQEHRFLVSEIEKERSGPSYTLDTIQQLQRQYPEHEFFLCLGADCLPEMHLWYHPQEICQLVPLLVAARPNYPVWSREQLADSLGISPSQVRLTLVEVPLIELASRDLRRRVQEKRSILYLVPHAVQVFISEKKLYRSE
ncbi:MAG: nicotinate-nucleotide adenylyltransferase [Gemmataceae bacterium]|jgi:nicotinate-nucleotide adenylyltransferase|nr:nicotinate-nucleotide adenylyltransferase [Gemmataceae bacterium]